MVQTDFANDTAATNPATNGTNHAGHDHDNNTTDHNGQTAEQRSSGTDSKNTTGQIKDMFANAAEELGIPPEYAKKIAGMFGFEKFEMMISVLSGITNKLRENGAHSEGGEIADGSHVTPPNINNGIDRGAPAPQVGSA